MLSVWPFETLSATIAVMPRIVADDSPEKIAERLRLVRVLMGPIKSKAKLTQAEAAAEVGVTASAWGNWEQASGEPERATAWKICQKSKVTLEWIYYGIRDRLPVHVDAQLEEAQKRLTERVPRSRGRRQPKTA